MEPHVGELVLEKLKEMGMKKSEFARRINKSRQNVQDIFKRPSLDTQLLFEISRVLKYNFFEAFSDIVNTSSVDILMEDQGIYKAAKGDKLKQKSQLATLKKQLKVAQKEIDYLKQINTLLEKKKENSSRKISITKKK